MSATPSHATVTSAEFVRQFGRWQDHAAAEPIVVTHHGRRRLVVLSTGQYQDLVAAPTTIELAPGAAGDDGEQLMEQVAQGFVAFGPAMTVTAINAAACAFLKVTRAAAVGRTLVDWLPGIEESLGYARLVRAAASGAVTTLEMPSFTYPGRWLLFRTFPHGPGTACLFHDITDELEARRTADARAATLAAIAAHGGVGRARLSPRGTFVEIDATFAGFAGFAAEGLTGARLTDILRPGSRIDAAREIEAVLTGGDARVLDTHVLTRHGEERALRLALAPLRTHHTPDGAIVIATLSEEAGDRSSATATPGECAAVF